MDDLKREVEQDAELQNIMRLLLERLGNADLDELRQAAERDDVTAMVKALGLDSVAQLDALDMMLWHRAQAYSSQYPDLRRFRRE